jgi:hypothetical protein
LASLPFTTVIAYFDCCRIKGEKIKELLASPNIQGKYLILFS